MTTNPGDSGAFSTAPTPGFAGIRLTAASISGHRAAPIRELFPLVNEVDQARDPWMRDIQTRPA
jgi:hypothetical protein